MASTTRERKGERAREGDRAGDTVRQVRTPTQLQLINFDALNLKGTTAQTCHKRQPQLQLQHTNAVKVRIIYTHEPRQKSQTIRQTERDKDRQRQRQGDRDIVSDKSGGSTAQMKCTNKMHNFVVNFWQFAYRKRTRALIAN